MMSVSGLTEALTQALSAVCLHLRPRHGAALSSPKKWGLRCHESLTSTSLRLNRPVSTLIARLDATVVRIHIDPMTPTLQVQFECPSRDIHPSFVSENRTRRRCGFVSTSQ